MTTTKLVILGTIKSFKLPIIFVADGEWKKARNRMFLLSYKMKQKLNKVLDVNSIPNFILETGQSRWRNKSQKVLTKLDKLIIFRG